MKKLLLLLVPLLIVVPTVKASLDNPSTKTGEFVEIKKGETVEGDYFITGDTVNISGDVNGDLYAAGGNINVTGRIDGDLLVAGGTVSISGEVTQDVRAAGGNIIISGTVGKNITALAGNIDLTNSANISGSLVAATGNLNIASKIPGSVNAAAGAIILTSSVGGDIEAGVGQLTLSSGASVGGDLIYYSEEDATIDQNASVSGNFIRNDPADHLRGRELDDAKNRITNFSKAFGKGMRLVGFIAALLTGFVILKFFPKCFYSVSNQIKSKPLRSAGNGFLLLFGIPLIIILLIIAIITIPLATIILAVYLISIYLTKIYVSFTFGQIFLEKAKVKSNDYLTLGIGLVSYTLLSFIPFFGGLFKFITLLIGAGALFISTKQSYIDLRKKGLI